MKISYYNPSFIEETLREMDIETRCHQCFPGCTYTTYAMKYLHFTTDSQLKNAIKWLEKKIGKKIEYNDLGGKERMFTISIPNKQRVFMSYSNNHSLLNTKPNGEILLGVDYMNKGITANIQDTKSILVGGSSGGGKSVCMNNLICSLLQHSSNVKICLIDLKKCEFTSYSKSKKLLFPVATSYSDAIYILERLLTEIKNRYNYMQRKGIRKASDKDFPITVCFIDEYAMLTSINQKEVDGLVGQISAVGRACNVYLVIATQTPTSKVISNTIRSNIQSRICLRTMNSAQSISILGTGDGVDLLGYGDAYLLLDGVPGLKRVQVFSITDEDINRASMY